MVYMGIHDVTSVRLETITPEKAVSDGRPYARRKLVVGTRDGEVELTLYSRIDFDAPKDMGSHLDALTVRDMAGAGVA